MDPTRIGIKTFLLTVAGILTLELLAGSVVRHTQSIPPLVYAGILRLFQTVFIIGVFNKTPAAIGLHPGASVHGLWRGVLWAIGFGCLAAIAMTVLYLTGLDPLAMLRINLPAQWPARILAVVVGCLIAPVAEELFFRGVIFGFLRRAGFAWALGLSTILFASAHLVSGLRFPLIELCGGLIFAIAYEHERNLIVPIVIHCLGNLTIFTLSIN